MGPDQIVLAPAREKDDNDDTTSLKTTPPAPPKPISEDVLDKLLKTQPITYAGTTKIIGKWDNIADPADVPLRVCCRCVRWDLTSEADRKAYAELVNLASEQGSSINIGWEERVIDGAAIIVYLTYLEYIRIVEDLDA